MATIRTFLLAACCGVVLLVLAVGSVGATPIITIRQIAPTVGLFFDYKLAINADGTRIAFVSSANLTGENPDLNAEIFLFDTTANTFTQITKTTIPFGSIVPGMSINANGVCIAFASRADLTGGNPGGNLEIFLFDTTANTFTQITTSTGGRYNNRPSINADGTRIAFQSTANFTGGNPDGNQEIFLVNSITRAVNQITNTTGGPIIVSEWPSISADGTRTAFWSAGNLMGGNPDFNAEIFLFDTRKDIFTQTSSQITKTILNGVNLASANLEPSISADGTRIVFTSDANLVQANSDGDREVFLADTLKHPTFTQITRTPSGHFNAAPSINANGTRIVFTSDADLTGENSDGRTEVFLFDITTKTFTQITTSPGGRSAQPSINADGTRIAFLSSANLTGENPEGNLQVFLADITEQAKIPGKQRSKKEHAERGKKGAAGICLAP